MRHPLGTLLTQEHMLKEEDLARVERACTEFHCSFEEAVTRLGILTPETLQVFKEHLPTLALSELVEADPVLLSLVPAAVARRHLVVPVARLGGTLTVAAADPSNREDLGALAREVGLRVEAVPALEGDVGKAITHLYGPDPGPDPDGPDVSLPKASPPEEAGPQVAANRADARPRASGPTVEVLIEDLADPPEQVVLAHRLLAQVLERGAERLEVRWKGDIQGGATLFVEGERESLSAVPPARAAQVIQRYRVLGDMLLQSRKKPQKGVLAVRAGGLGAGGVEERRFQLQIVPIGDLEGEVATVAPWDPEGQERPGAAGAPATPDRCPACGSEEVHAGYRYCPMCGVGVR